MVADIVEASHVLHTIVRESSTAILEHVDQLFVANEISVRSEWQMLVNFHNLSEDVVKVLPARDFFVQLVHRFL